MRLFSLRILFFIVIILPINAANNKKDNDELNWSIQLAKIANEFFNKPYKHDILFWKNHSPNTITRNINGKTYKVFRKNHGLAHSIRQGFLAIDIITTIEERTKTKTFFNEESKKFREWITKKIHQDSLFKKKVMFATVFQRSGRESEVNSISHPLLYNSYERNDAKNFYKTAIKYVGKNNLFNSLNELNVYKEAILWSTKNEGKLDENINEDLKYIRKILHTAHILDLRRITSFSISTIKLDVAKELFGGDIIDTKIKSQYAVEKAIIEFLWQCSGNYLKITGDRDGEKGKNFFSNEFFILSNNPIRLANALYKSREFLKIYTK